VIGAIYSHCFALEMVNLRMRIVPLATEYDAVNYFIVNWLFFERYEVLTAVLMKSNTIAIWLSVDLQVTTDVWEELSTLTFGAKEVNSF
jgi:hypothetical protein